MTQNTVMESKLPVIRPRSEGKPQENQDVQPPELNNWHFPMMNDAVRNAAYEKALGAALKKLAEKDPKQSRLVLDIGTGAGLLAMMAARQGAERVITCEEISSIAKKAQEIVVRNGLADRVQVLNKFSTNLVVGVDLPERADILVTETFDDGLLGEWAFDFYKHAKKDLLKPGAQMIPAKARVYAMAFESQEMYENHRVGMAAGFDLSPFNELAARVYTGYHLDKINYRPLGRPQQVFEFDFSNVPADKNVPFEFEAIGSGTLHAVAYWFELQLDEETMISTAPGLEKRSSWKQAVQMIEGDLKVTQGQKVSLVAFHDAEAIWFKQIPSSAPQLVKS